MKEYKILIPTEVSEYIERLHYEKQTRDYVVHRILTSEKKYNEELFNDYNKQLVCINAEYEIAKSELSKLFIPKELKNHQISWVLNFSDHVLEITQHCDCEVVINEEV